MVARAADLVSIPACPGGCPGQSATKECIPRILTLSFNNEGSCHPTQICLHSLPRLNSRPQEESWSADSDVFVVRGFLPTNRQKSPYIPVHGMADARRSQV